MDPTRAQLEELLATGDSKFEFTKMLNWLHIRDRETGEGYWVWCGPEKTQIDTKGGAVEIRKKLL